MLRLWSDSLSPTCDGMTRRGLLQVGCAGFGGASLFDAFRAVVLAGGTEGSYLRGKSVVFLVLGGGPSQHETFDPKPHGPGTSTSLAGHLPTALPGVRFATYLPKLAALADRLTVVRSFQTNHAEHNGAHKQLMTADLTVKDGKPIREPGLGSVYARAAGAVHPRTGMPRQAILPPTTRHLGFNGGFAGAYDSIVEGCQPAWLGPAYTPLELNVPMRERPTGAEAIEKLRKQREKQSDEPGNPLLADLEPRLPDLRMNARVDLLRQLDRVDRFIDHSGVMESVDHFGRQSLELLRGGAVRKALDLSLEDAATLTAYDTERFRNWKVDDNSRFIRSGPSIGSSLGRQLLMARRLCEAGCGFVTVIHPNWDFHARKGIPNMPEGMGVLAPPLDHAVAAFLEDLDRRGLTDDILLVVTGEFGRTPKLDENLGRHHWPRLCPLVLAGGGLDHGRVVGRSDRRGGEPDGEPVTIDDLHATVLHTLFDVGRLRLDPSIPGAVLDRASKGHPIGTV